MDENILVFKVRWEAFLFCFLLGVFSQGSVGGPPTFLILSLFHLYPCIFSVASFSFHPPLIRFVCFLPHTRSSFVIAISFGPHRASYFLSPAQLSS